jgi:hypothetical protein
MAIIEILDLEIVPTKGHLSLTTLTHWFNQFKRGLDHLKDKHLKERPITETIHANIERVRADVVHISYLDKVNTKDIRHIL